MKEFTAKNPKQLDICLRMLYAENLHFVVRVIETEKGKILYTIGIRAKLSKYQELSERYRILTS
jgi:hypothetical protein